MGMKWNVYRSMTNANGNILDFLFSATRLPCHYGVMQSKKLHSEWWNPGLTKWKYYYCPDSTQCWFIISWIPVNKLYLLQCHWVLEIQRLWQRGISLRLLGMVAFVRSTEWGVWCIHSAAPHLKLDGLFNCIGFGTCWVKWDSNWSVWIHALLFQLCFLLLKLDKEKKQMLFAAYSVMTLYACSIIVL